MCAARNIEMFTRQWIYPKALFSGETGAYKPNMLVNKLKHSTYQHAVWKKRIVLHWCTFKIMPPKKKLHKQELLCKFDITKKKNTPCLMILFFNVNIYHFPVIGKIRLCFFFFMWVKLFNIRSQQEIHSETHKRWTLIIWSWTCWPLNLRLELRILFYKLIKDIY